jgi:hypothetical protein
MVQDMQEMIAVPASVKINLCRRYRHRDEAGFSLLIAGQAITFSSRSRSWP